MTDTAAPPQRLSALELIARRIVDDAERRGDASVTDVTHDSRRVAPGSLFVALPGAHSDGHAHAAEAVGRGAVALVVSRFLDLPVPQLRVPVTRPVAGPLASAVHGEPSRHLKVAGITGTNGKTTAAYLIEAAAGASGIPTGLIGTIETRLQGVATPSTLTTPQAPDVQRTLAAMRAAGAAAVAMEVSSHALDQGRVAGTRFETALFTNLEPEHLDYHGTVEHYWSAKAELFTPAYTGRAVICVDDVWGQRLAAQTPVPALTFGRAGSGADVIYRIAAADQDGLTVALEGRCGLAVLRSRLVGRHTAPTLVGAYLCALHLGAEPEAARRGLASCPRPPGRFELVDEGQSFDVVVDYAHTPESLRGLIDAARGLAGREGRTHVVVGARGGRDRLKRPGTARAAATADRVTLTTDNPGDEDPAAILAELRVGVAWEPPGRIRIEPDRRQAIRAAIEDAGAGDVVVIAGRGHETTVRMGARQVALDDREVARESLRRRLSGRREARPIPGGRGSSRAT